MATLTLNLKKEGEDAPKLQLNLKKNEKFKVLLGWKGQTDLDLHALRCVNSGAGAKVTAFEEILSTYNVQRTISGKIEGTLVKKADGSFDTLGGALVHSPDVTDGDSLEIDEYIIIDPALMSVPAGSAIEIPLIAMIHPQSGTSKFRDVDDAWVAVQDSDSNEIMRAQLSTQFGEFVGVQMGSLIIDASGTHFEAVGVGFNENFNGVLSYFT